MCFSAEIDINLQNLAKRFKARIDQEAYQKFQDLREKFPKDYKIPGEDNRIYPNYFAPVILEQNGQRMIKPMRYRVRPAGSHQEIPSKYNVFNARLDSLESRVTWKNLFMHSHGLFPFKSFYEWVEDEKGKKVLINFRPDTHELMWAPCLWDFWQDPAKEPGKEFFSFALITHDPPPEIERMGHDRCPIFLQEDFIDQWLRPQGRSRDHRDQMLKILNHQEKTYFHHQLSA